MENHRRSQHNPKPWWIIIDNLRNSTPYSPPERAGVGCVILLTISLLSSTQVDMALCVCRITGGDQSLRIEYHLRVTARPARERARRMNRVREEAREAFSLTE